MLEYHAVSSPTTQILRLLDQDDLVGFFVHQFNAETQMSRSISKTHQSIANIILFLDIDKS
ncbi:MAG: hypothetical protein ACD_4C00373G0004 [uncultured bacterium (gcode 4)]|uniref:Uncharacterized protein n=1 Tax=uncultured bacterium (gcode 4) TaxID=1234023 RepID=K2G829_9BACT|nr:MAG: hypothetical protein ACD_4C00373G0004 [uncultured bacterium (gcode 4)]